MKPVDPRNIDAFTLAQKQGVVSGETALARFLRLCEGLPEQDGLASWDVQGAIGPGTGKTGVIAGQPLLRLHVRAQLRLDCQRCGQPFTLPVDAQAVLQLVESEADLDDELGLLQDDEDVDDRIGEDSTQDGMGSFLNQGEYAVEGYPDKVVGSRHFDLLAQVEDELILNVPYVPRHEVCQNSLASAVPPGQTDQTDERRPSPFAALEQLKGQFKRK